MGSSRGQVFAIMELTVGWGRKTLIQKTHEEMQSGKWKCLEGLSNRGLPAQKDQRR